jgi:outer membrane protein OmpA-like peptidoglycan-associated protein
MSVKVDGYCDSRGAEKYNQKLSERRAETVREALRFYGVPDQKIVATGYASTHPVAPNDNEEDMAKNRRTELRTARF